MPSPRREEVPVLRPLPQRNWQLTPSSTEPGTPPGSDSPIAGNEQQQQQAFDGANDGSNGKSMPPSRTRSILNLTSSTLFGIYSQPGASSADGASQVGTPFGSMTPSVPSTPFLSQSSPQLPSPRAFAAASHRRGSSTVHHRKTRPATVVARTALLFAVGLAYGEVATRLHEDTEIVPVKMEGIDKHTWWYLLFWGAAGVVLGHTLPWVDALWEEEEEVYGIKDVQEQQRQEKEKANVDWSLVVRGVGAFIGMAFAIRRLPWESSMQASLTLALANPAAWYLVDRSLTGFMLSTSVGLVGAAIILGVNPEWVPSTPAVHNSTHHAAEASASSLSYEHIAVSTWVASVLFCSCVCFGNIGRVLHGRGTRT